MIVRTQTVRFDANRVPMPRVLRAGYTTDHLVERLVFVLPDVSAQQSAVLMLTQENGEADIGLLQRSDNGRWQIDLPLSVLGDGAARCFVRIDGSGGEIWNSGTLTLLVGELEGVEQEVEHQYPTAVSQMLSEMAAHDARMDAQEAAVNAAVKEAAEAAQAAEGVPEAAQSAKDAAEAAQSAKDSAVTAASTASSASETATSAAQSAQTNAQSAASAAQTAATSAATAKSDAERAQTASESAQEAAESARQAAQEASGAVQGLIDDEAVSAERVWSSRQVVERFCPAFEASGTAVSCYPVAHYPLGVVSRVDAVQAGEGDPSPDNVRPISGHEAAVLTQNGTAYEVSFGEPVYGGSHDWSTGVCTVSHKRLVLTGEETYASYSYWGYDGVQINNVLDGRYTRASGICSHAPVALTTSKHNQVWIGVSTPHVYWIGAQGQLGVSTVDEVKAYIAQQYAAGNPVTVVYQMANPMTLQLEGMQIAAQEGENVISCTSGQVTVSGRADPKYVIGALETRVAALEAALVSG